MRLRIHGRGVHPVQDSAEAVAVYVRLRDASGEGASSWPRGVLSDGRKIFYNGKLSCADADHKPVAMHRRPNELQCAACRVVVPRW